MADIAGVIVGPLMSCICGTPTCNCIHQYRNFNDDVAELRRKLEILTGRKQDIESRMQVVAEAHGGQMVKQEVQEWLKHAQDINGDVQVVLEKAKKVKWYKRACLGKLVSRKINVVEKMHEKGSFPEGLVIERATTREVIIPTENLVGEISTKNGIWECLMGDEIGLVGVCGIGGVGKTTIMEHVYNDLKRETKFQKVIWVTVSYPLNVFELQKKIARAMGQTLPEDEEEKMRAAILMQIMTRVRYVAILDDVWEKFSLKDVGIPEPTVQNGCKVVITSRSTEVCSFLGCKIIKVQPLSQEESLTLFLKKVGHDVLQISGLEDILKLIVKECAGLPLAIVVIAGSMKGVDDIKVWRNALTELQECVKSVKGSDDEIFVRLRFSFDRLANMEIKNCFLYCSLFHEDYSFERQVLIEGWIDEGIIDGLRSRGAAYDRGQAFLDMLEKNCLLEKHFRSEIEMHDVVRDMAIKVIGCGVGYMVKAGMKLTEVPNEHEWATDLNKVSLMANDISKIPVGLTPKCPTLSTLILSNNPLMEIPESFFQDMSGLKVLDLSKTNIEVLPDSISKLEYLSALRLRECERLKCLPSLEKLGALKKLDLKWAGIEVVPQGMEKLVSLEYLDLFCPNLKEIPTAILPNLSRLQYLVVYPWRAFTKRINLEEVARLSKLESLECELEDIQDFNYFVNESKDFQSLTAYEVRVRTEKKDDRGYIFGNNYQRKVLICEYEIGEERIVLPDTLEELWINGCKNMRSSLNKTALLENATELRSCAIWDCEEIECMVELDSSSSLCCPVLDKLEKLYLVRLPRFCVLVGADGVAIPPDVFSNLKILSIYGCSGMRELLPLQLLRALQNLEKIHVTDCKQMEEIVVSSNSEASSDIFTFPKLKELNLIKLPQLKSICSAKGVMVCDFIEQIQVWRCRNLKRIPLKLPLLDNGQPSPPPRLRKIKIDEESKEWWDSVVELDHPNAKNILQPFLKLTDDLRYM